MIGFKVPIFGKETSSFECELRKCVQCGGVVCRDFAGKIGNWLLATRVEQRLFSWLEIKIQYQFLACLAIARLRNLYATDMDVVWNLY